MCVCVRVTRSLENPFVVENSLFWIQFSVFTFDFFFPLQRNPSAPTLLSSSFCFILVSSVISTEENLSTTTDDNFSFFQSITLSLSLSLSVWQSRFLLVFPLSRRMRVLYKINNNVALAVVEVRSLKFYRNDRPDFLIRLVNFYFTTSIFFFFLRFFFHFIYIFIYRFCEQLTRP